MCVNQNDKTNEVWSMTTANRIQQKTVLQTQASFKIFLPSGPQGIMTSATLTGFHNHIWQLFYLKKVTFLIRQSCDTFYKHKNKSDATQTLRKKEYSPYAASPHSTELAMDLELAVHSRVGQRHQDYDVYIVQVPTIAMLTNIRRYQKHIL